MSQTFVSPFSPKASSGGIIACTFWPTFISATIELIPLVTAVLLKKKERHDMVKGSVLVIGMCKMFQSHKAAKAIFSHLPSWNPSAFFLPMLCVASKMAPFERYPVYSIAMMSPPRG